MSLKPLTRNLLSIIVIILVFTNGYLLRANVSYMKSNRRLILQNDSLSSVIIELNKTTSYQKMDSLSTNMSMYRQSNYKR